ncbi:MAG: ABC transporter permease, partial [Oceanicaulis sp.]
PDGFSYLDAAIEAAGLGEAGAGLGTERRDQVLVEPPARDIEGLRPFLTGERTISTPEGERALFAAIILTQADAAPVRLEYHSANVTSDAVKDAVRDVLGLHFRRQAFMERGLTQADIEAVRAMEADVVEIDARPGAQAGAEVTRADRAPFIVAIGLAFVLWLAVFSVANMLLTSLVEEKGGKIIELLLSTARFHEILIGKLAGVAGVSVTLFAIWGAVGGGLALLGGAVLAGMNPQIAELLASLFDPGLIAAALFFFAVGYLMYGAIFLAMGSLCDTLQDAQTLMGPVIWTLLLPMFFLVFSIEATDSVLLRAASWFPLWTPFLMMARLPTDPPLWELAGASGLMIVTMVLVVWGAAAVFRQGALRQADADSVRRFLRLKKKA